MLSQTEIEERNFKLYRSSSQGPSNPIGSRDDYLSVAKVGEAEYLIVLEYYETGDLKIKDFWNDPILYPEYYYAGVVLTEEQLDSALADTRFEKFVEIDFDDINEYR